MERVESRFSVTNEEIDSFIGQRVKVTLESGRTREGELKRSNNDSRILVRGLGYDVLRNVIAKIEPLP
jgi:ribosome maturation factor RimP